MKDRHYYSFIISVLFLFFLLDAFVSTAISSGKDNYYIRKFDKDEDGKLSKEEYPGSDTSFKNRDKNNDGYLDENEVYKGPSRERTQMGERGGGYIHHFDKDKDGKLSKEEYPGSDTSFNNRDKNSDGYIDEDEVHKGPSGMRSLKGERGDRYIRNFDKDKDGKLSKEEYPGSDTSFNNWDKNNDGYIDEDEARKGPSGMRSPKGERGGGYIRSFDKDKDGKLSREEYPGSDSSFNNQDENSDGYIDSNEIKKRRPSKTVPHKI
jgi:Ca2+-binding EF-hand superfamily protein